MGVIDNLGKKAEMKIKEWLDRPEEGFCFDRIPDQQSGFFGSNNISDFTLFRLPHFYYIESKATEHDNFPVSMITDYQKKHMLEKSKIEGVHSYVIVLFATYQRAFIFNIQDLVDMENNGQKSLNIKKIEKWPTPFREIATISSRKMLLDYDFEDAKEIFK